MQHESPLSLDSGYTVDPKLFVMCCRHAHQYCDATIAPHPSLSALVICELPSDTCHVSCIPVRSKRHSRASSLLYVRLCQMCLSMDTSRLCSTLLPQTSGIELTLVSSFATALASVRQMVSNRACFTARHAWQQGLPCDQALVYVPAFCAPSNCLARMRACSTVSGGAASDIDAVFGKDMCVHVPLLTSCVCD